MSKESDQNVNERWFWKLHTNKLRENVNEVFLIKRIKHVCSWAINKLFLSLSIGSDADLFISYFLFCSKIFTKY